MLKMMMMMMMMMMLVRMVTMIMIMMMIMIVIILPAGRQLHTSNVYTTRAVALIPSATSDGLDQRSQRSSIGPRKRAAFRLAMEMAASAGSLSVLLFKERLAVRRLPRVDDAPGATACTAANVHEVSARGFQAAMS